MLGVPRVVARKGRDLMHRSSVIVELVHMVVRHRKWVLLPPILVLMLVGALMFAAQATPLGPLIYPIF